MWKWIKRFLEIPKPKYPERRPEALALKFGTDVVALGLWLEKNIWYVKDTKPADEWKLPYKTLEDGKGDCEDFALLAFSILRAMGCSYCEVIAFYPYKGPGHAICVFKGFDTNNLFWFDNGELRTTNIHYNTGLIHPDIRANGKNRIAATSNLEKDLEEICNMAAEKQGWIVAHWRHTGFKHEVKDA